MCIYSYLSPLSLSCHIESAHFVVYPGTSLVQSIHEILAEKKGTLLGCIFRMYQFLAAKISYESAFKGKKHEKKHQNNQATLD